MEELIRSYFQASVEVAVINSAVWLSCTSLTGCDSARIDLIWLTERMGSQLMRSSRQAGRNKSEEHAKDGPDKVSRLEDDGCCN